MDNDAQQGAHESGEMASTNVDGIAPLEMNNVQKSSEYQSNMRDIGTWNNKQMNNRFQNKPHNRHMNNNNSNNGRKTFPNTQNDCSNPAKEEEWENDEEWQGDLTQTQIFTPSVQKKEESV
jgi:hypothetical protein